MELFQELTTTRTHLTLFLFSDCLEVSLSPSPTPSPGTFVRQITKLRVNTWKTPGMKASKSYKHVALIPLSDIRSLYDITPSALTIDGRSLLRYSLRKARVNARFRDRAVRSLVLDRRSNSSADLSRHQRQCQSEHCQFEILFYRLDVIALVNIDTVELHSSRQ